MKKLALLFAAILCLPVLGLTGCGGSNETTVVPVPADTGPEMTPEEEAQMEADMEAAQNQGP